MSFMNDEILMKKIRFSKYSKFYIFLNYFLLNTYSLSSGERFIVIQRSVFH